MSEETSNWLEQLSGENTDEAARNEALRRDTVRGGKYRLKVAKIKPDTMPDNTGTPGRYVLKLTVDAVPEVTNGEDVKSTKLFFDISPVPYKSVVVIEDGKEKRIKVTRGHEAYTPAAKFDLQYKNWVGLEALMVKKNESITMGEFVNRLDGLEFGAYVSESFIDPDGNFQNYENEEERQAYLNEGWESKNYVMQIRK